MPYLAIAKATCELNFTHRIVKNFGIKHLNNKNMYTNNKTYIVNWSTCKMNPGNPEAKTLEREREREDVIILQSIEKLYMDTILLPICFNLHSPCNIQLHVGPSLE